MDIDLIFNFKTDISKLTIPSELNNPFGAYVPEIARKATQEFQEFIVIESQKWKYDFFTQKGKMFGALVVQKDADTYAYIGTVSGKLPGKGICNNFIPSIFDDSVGDYFINKGMTELTEIGGQIKNCPNPSQVKVLNEKRRSKSIALQQRLFENYHILNLSGETKNLIEIFEDASYGNPPSAAGECVAPKLLQYAITHGLKPIALAEFWWGRPNKNNEKKHNTFYPACKSRCRPILEFMLEDTDLYNTRKVIVASAEIPK